MFGLLIAKIYVSFYFERKNFIRFFLTSTFSAFKSMYNNINTIIELSYWNWCCDVI